MNPAASHLPWGAESLWQQLEPLLPGLSVEVVARTDSTNSQLVERARLAGTRRDRPGPPSNWGAFDAVAAGSRPAPLTAREPSPYGRRADDTQPCLLVAEHQTRGRGRHGRTWQSRAGASLTFSLALAMHPADWSGLSLAVGAALAEAIDPAGTRVGVKWPNDLWLREGPGRGRKLGGVLIETVPVGARRMAVVGVGLNVLPQSLRDLASGYACLQELWPAIDAPGALQLVARPLVEALLEFDRAGFAAFAARFAQRDLLRGERVQTSDAAAPEGIADGVEPDGALRVRVAGRVHALASVDVSARPAGAEPPAPGPG